MTRSANRVLRRRSKKTPLFDQLVGAGERRRYRELPRHAIHRL